MADKPIGTMYVELDLDASRYTKGQQKLLKDAQSASLNIEQNFKNLGIKSSAEMDLMRAKIKNSFDMIANSSKATANDILRAERAKNEQLEALNKKQFGDQAGMLEGIKGKWIGAAAAVYAAYKTINTAIDMTVAGSKLEKQSAAFENLATSAGTSADKMLASLRRASQGMIADADLIGAAGKAMLLKINPSEISRLMEIAAATSRSTGQTITEAFSDVTHGVARQSREILDNLGILVDVDKANQDYAKTLGKTSEALTDAEKRQAFMNSVMKSGDEMIKRLGSAQGDLQNVNRLIASGKNLWDETNKALATYLDDRLSRYPGLIDIITEKLKNLKDTEYYAAGRREAELQAGLRQWGITPASAAGKKRELEIYNRMPSEAFIADERRAREWKNQSDWMASWRARERSDAYFEYTEEEKKAMIAARDKALKDIAAAKPAKNIWEGWGVRPYTESEAFLADERAWEDYKKRWAGYEQRLPESQQSEAMLADQKRWEEWKKAGEDGFNSMVQLSERTADAIEQNFSDVFFDMWKGELKTAEDYFKAFADSIGRMAADLAGQMLKTGLIGAGQNGQGVGGLLGSLVGHFGSSGPEQLGQYNSRGNVFGPGGFERFAAGGVVTRPTVFAFARGVGIMGEAGPEAILPLKRGAGGRLGVEAAGAGVNVVVNNYSSERASVKETRGPDNSRQIMVVIGQDIAAGGPIARAIESTYGVSRAGRLG